MVENETKRLVKSAFFLTLASLISKILSAGYRIPLQNLTGDLGFYIYQQIYPILGITLVLSLYGFPSAVSKMTVELKAEGKFLSFKSFYVPLFLIMLSINGMLFLFLYFNAQTLAIWIGDANLKHAYQLTAFVFLFIPFTALLRGVFQGSYDMLPTAYSQIGEQLIRVFIIIFTAFLFVSGKVDIYKIGHAAAIASLVGASIAIIILSIFFIRKLGIRQAFRRIALVALMQKENMDIPSLLLKKKRVVMQSSSTPWNYYLRSLFILGIVASLNHMVLLIIQFADVFTLVPSLMEYGLSQVEAKEAKGVFDRGQPLIQLGTVLGSSFALALIPAISKRKLQEEPKIFYEYIQGALIFSFYLAAGATIGLIVLFPDANTLLFQNTKGTTSLQILVVAIFLSSIAITMSSILQGLGYLKRTAVFIIIAFFVKWIANQLFVPWWGITGSAIATVLSLLILCTLVLFELKRKLPQLAFFKKINWLAFIKASFGMVAYILLVNYLSSFASISSRLELLVYIMFIAISGGLVYILLLLRNNAFTERELSMLPFASVFIRLNKGRDFVE